jgi:hypothetical protein
MWERFGRFVRFAFTPTKGAWNLIAGLGVSFIGILAWTYHNPIPGAILGLSGIIVLLAVAGYRLEARLDRERGFRVTASRTVIDVKSIVASNPDSAPPELSPAERFSLYVPLSVMAVNRGPAAISITLNLRARWKDGTMAQTVPLDSATGLRTWVQVRVLPGSDTSLTFPLNVAPETSQAGWVGFIIMPLPSERGIEDLDALTLSVTEHISGAEDSFDLPGELEMRP